MFLGRCISNLQYKSWYANDKNEILQEVNDFDTIYIEMINDIFFASSIENHFSYCINQLISKKKKNRKK